MNWKSIAGSKHSTGPKKPKPISLLEAALLLSGLTSEPIKKPLDKEK